VITVLTEPITRPAGDFGTATCPRAERSVISCCSRCICSTSCCSRCALDPLRRRPTVGGSPATCAAIGPASGGRGRAVAGSVVPGTCWRPTLSRSAARCPPCSAPCPTQILSSYGPKKLPKLLNDNIIMLLLYCTFIRTIPAILLLTIRSIGAAIL